MNDHDDPDFNPRLFWAKANNEDLAWLHDVYNRYNSQMKVLWFLKESERTSEELYKTFNLTKERLESFYREFRRRGVRLERRWENKKQVYTLSSDPKDYKFSERPDYRPV